MTPRDPQTQPRFTWPPLPDRPVEVAPQSTPIPIKPEPRCRAWWRDIERDLLAPTALPLEDRIKRAEWSPDHTAAYCQRCAHTIGPHEPDEFGCALCRNKRPPWAFAARVGLYESHLADWIREVKFHRNRWLAVSLGHQLAHAIRRAGLDQTPAAVIPLPTSRRRRLSRGLDHTLALARGVAHTLECPVARPLARAHRASQLSVPVSQRPANVSGAFSLRKTRNGIRAGGPVVLVDDVMTTGSSIRAACRALLDAGIPRERLWIAVLGVAPEPDRRSESPRGPHVDNAEKPVFST